MAVVNVAAVDGCPALAAAVAMLQALRRIRDKLQRKEPAAVPLAEALLASEAANDLKLAAREGLAGRPIPGNTASKTEVGHAAYQLAVYEMAIVWQVEAIDAFVNKSRHKAIVRRLRQALAALVEAQRAELDFHHEMGTCGIGQFFPDAAFRVPFGTRHETLEAAEQWLADHADYLRQP